MADAPASPLRTYALAGLAVLAAAAIWRNVPHLAPGLANWAESGNTAAALVEGRGFSDPFAGGTGPTAWIPPVFVWLIAAVFAVAGVKTAAASVILLVLAVLGLAVTHVLLVASAPPDARWMRRVTSLAFLAYATLLPANPLELTSEAWLNVLLSALLLWAALEHTRAPRRNATLLLVTTAALAPLTNAGLTVATAGVLLVLLWRERAAARPRGAWRPVVSAALAATLAVAAWTARNAVVLHRFVPLKSNAWFELNLANVAATDGLPRTEHILQLLPFFSAPEFARYAALGEMAYTDSFRAPSLAALRAAPLHFAGNIARRTASALVFCRHDSGAAFTKTKFSAADTQRLAQAGWFLPVGNVGGYWTRIDAPTEQARAFFASLRLERPAEAWADWAEQRLDYDRRNNSLLALWQGFVIAGVPSLALLAAALGWRGRMPAVVNWTALILAGMLFPFVLVNHGLRHQASLFALHAVLLGAGVQAWISRRGAPVAS